MTDPWPPRPQLARRTLLKNVALTSLSLPIVGAVSACSNNPAESANTASEKVNWSNFTLYMPVDDEGAFPLVKSCAKESRVKSSNLLEP